MKAGRAYPAAAWALAALVAAALVAEWIALYLLQAGPGGGPEQIDRKRIVSKLAVEVIAFSAIGIAVIGIAVKTWLRSAPILVQECVQLIREAGSRPGGAPAVRDALAATAREVAGGGMGDCEDVEQWAAHLMIMWGFIGLFATTSLDALVNRAADPLPLLHPVRLLGNATGIVFQAGLTLALARRALLERVRSVPGDWLFLWSLWGTGATGFAVQWYASTGQLAGTKWTYLAHLGFVAGILLFAPWTKFLHAVWRPSWALYRSLKAIRA